MRRTWLALAACLALVLAGGGTAAASVAAPAGDGPPGFWWGSDSWPIPVTGSAPYSMPRLLAWLSVIEMLATTTPDVRQEACR